MKQVVRSALVVCLVVSLGASTTAQLPGLSPADSKELASYRLSMDTAKKVHEAMKSLIVEAKKDPKVQALMKTEAAIEALEKKQELTDAESERLDRLREERDQQKEVVEKTIFGGGMNLGNGDSLDAIEAEIKRHPQATAALNDAGVSPREYARFMMSVIMAGLVAGFQKSGALKDLPKELQGIPAENIKFMHEHGLELEQMQKELAALSKGMA